MLTIDDWATLGDEARLLYFLDIAETRYGTEKGIPAKIGAEFGVHEKTVFAWKKKPSSIPFFVIAAIERANETAGERNSRIRAGFADIAASLEATALKFAEISRLLKD